MSINDLKKFRQGGQAQVSSPKAPSKSSSNISQFKSSIRQPQQKSSNILDFKKNTRKEPEKKGFWNTITTNLTKPVSAASNLLEDTGKTIGYGIGRALGSKKTKQDLGIDFFGHQKEVWSGQKLRTYSDITKDIAKDMPKVQGTLLKTVGYGGDFLLDPLNKIKLLGLTAKGVAASKTGKVALSVAEQAKNGQRALLQIGNKNILPKLGNKVLSGSTKLNDFIRGNKYGEKVVTAASKLNGKIRPAGVSRQEFSTIQNALGKARNTVGYRTDKAIELGTEFQKTLKGRKATQFERSQLLHAIEKGEERLAPTSFQDLWKKGVDFKTANSDEWSKLGGSLIEGHGLSHIATKEVSEGMRKSALKKSGNKLYTTMTPQDNHRQWVKVVEDASLDDGKKFFTGQTVKSADRKNFGKIESITGNTAKVRFTNKAEKTSALVDMELEKLTPQGGFRTAPTKGAPKMTESEVEIANAKNYQQRMIDDEAKRLRGQEEQLGVGLRHNGSSGIGTGGDMNMVRFSEHGQKYREFFKKNGRKPSLDFWKQVAKEDLEKGNSPLSEEFKAINEYMGSVSPMVQAEKQDALKAMFAGGKEKVVNLKDEGVRYFKSKGFVDKNRNPVLVKQATAQEINNELARQGKKDLFVEEPATVIAKMGISTGRKQAGVQFLNEVKKLGKLSPEAEGLMNSHYEKMTNIEAINKAIEGFDKVQNIWKAQALVAPAYHIRNMAGNLWNNYLAGVSPTDYGYAAKVQKQMKSGKFTGKIGQLVDEMEKHGVIGNGQYGGDITQAIDDQIGMGTLNPFSQRFIGYKANKAVGSVVEDNARMAHYLTKRRSGFNAEEAAKSVKQYLFDYGDLTWAEKNVMKRIMPFYTWTSKNIPMQVEAAFNNPGKFSKIAVAKKDREAGVEQPNEKYLSDYIKNNAPVRIRTDKDGSTQYLLLGSWLPATSALNILSQPADTLVAMLSPAFKMPIETMLNKSSFFKNSLGEYSDIETTPGQKKNYLGLDIDPRLKNIVSSIRILNELDKLNPGEIFGSKDKGSIWNKLNVPIASKKRGSRYSPDSSQTSRNINLLFGKSTTYDPKNSKFFYDRDTQKRASDYKQAIKEAQKNKQPEMAKKASQDLKDFLKERNGR